VTAVVIQHLDVEGPYEIGRALERRGVELSVGLPSSLDGVEALVVMGGPQSAHSDDGFPTRQTELALLAEAVERGIPTLGVCLGLQCAAIAFGARVVRAPEPRHGKTSFVRHDGKGIFAGVPDPTEATRYHSLMVDEASLPADLAVTARSDDGVVMALRHARLPLEAVQFHPESVLTKDGMLMLENFLGRA